MGVSMGDFMVMTPREAEAVCSAYREAEDARVRGAWERSRLMAYSSVSPYLGKKGPKSPQKFLPLPWDHKGVRSEELGVKSKEHDNKAAIALLRKLNGQG